MKTLKTPKLPLELMRTFYAGASEFYRRAPWEVCADSDLFGVMVPETAELHFVSIMGGGGQCFGLATYRGYRGLELFEEIVTGGAFLDPDRIRLKQDGLLLEFVQKKYLDVFDRQAVKDAAFSPVDAKGWVLVRELSPGWVPWAPAEKDVVALCQIMTVIPEFVARQEDDPDWTMGKTGRTVPVFTKIKNNQPWKLEWWGQQKIIKNSLAVTPEQSSQPVNELLFERIRRNASKRKVRWETHAFYAHEAVVEDQRPFYPKICALLDQHEGLCLGLELAIPTRNAALVLRDLVLKNMADHQTIPEVVTVSDEDHLFGLIMLNEAFGIEIELTEPVLGEEFEEDFHRNVEGGF